MQARDVMTTAVVCVEPETDVQQIAKLLNENRISAVPVKDRLPKWRGRRCGH
jgi:CBS domain-containing protein